MGLHDIKTEIKFGAMVAFSTVELEITEAKKYKKDHIAANLGLKIAEAKGWIEFSDPVNPEIEIAELRLYVFTPNELADYMDAKFKMRILQRIETDGDKITEQTREELHMIAERI